MSRLGENLEMEEKLHRKQVRVRVKRKLRNGENLLRRKLIHGET